MTSSRSLTVGPLNGEWPLLIMKLSRTLSARGTFTHKLSRYSRMPCSIPPEYLHKVRRLLDKDCADSLDHDLVHVYDELVTFCQ